MRPWTAFALSMLIALTLPAASRAADGAPATLQQAEALLASGQASEAAAVLQQLTDQGDRVARTRLARLYETGQGVPQDIVRAARLYEKAAFMGDPEAQFTLAGLFLEGRGVPADRMLSVVWLRKAAANGHPEARAIVGLPPLASSPEPAASR